MQYCLRINTLLLILIVAALVGCTTYVGNVKKLDGYNKNISKVNVVWVKPKVLKTRLTKSGRGVGRITEEEKEASKNGIKTLYPYFWSMGKV